jgi:ribosomal protein L5
MDRRVRKSLGTQAVEYHFRTGDAELDRLLQQVRAVREAARTFDARAHRLIGRVLTLHGSGSSRDLAVLLGMSHQRVHQLKGQRNAATSERGELWH